MKSIFPMVLTAAALAGLCSCKTGPDFKKPDVAEITPADWRWKVAAPSDAEPKGEWWNIFDDATLNDLERKALEHNQDLQAAIARLDQARAAARISGSERFPTIGFDPSFKRERTSGNLPTPIPIEVPASYLNTYSVPFDLSYEVDLWGRVRRSFEAAGARAAATAADFQNVLLTLTADVAFNYFLIRSLESEIEILRQTIELREQSLRILAEKFDAGILLEIDLARARTELADSKAELADTRRQREETLHVLALLCGKAAGTFEIPAEPKTSAVVVVPPGLPSALLERRPDIATAERNLAAHNANIGVAKAAYFPALRLTGQAGYLSAEADDLFTADSLIWSIGPSISLPVFNAGRTKAEVHQAQAAYREAAAEYRQTVVRAFKEVEDALAQITFRGDQSSAQAEAVTSARRVTELARARYEAGTADYLDFLEAERTLLQHQRRQAQLDGQQHSASVRLIKALGGGWEIANSKNDRP